MSTAERVCPECGGTTEADEDFCGQCGAYLAWDPATATEGAPTAPDPEPEPDVGGRTLLERVKEVIAPSAGTPAPTAAPPGPAGPPPTSTASPGVAPEAAPDGTHGPVASGPKTPVRGTRLVVPIEEAQAGPRRPEAVKPTVVPPRPRPRSRAGRDEPLHPGDLVCGQCGAGNKPTRKYCRRCGRDLVEATVVKVPWWRRVFARTPRSAGSRPDRRPRLRLPRGLVVLLVVVLVVAGGAYAARGRIGDAANAVRDRVGGNHEINPDRCSGTPGRPGHGAALVCDGDSASFWSPPGNGRGARLTATFAQPHRIVHIIVTPGAAGQDQKAWLHWGRPSHLRVKLTRDDGSTNTKTVNLPDSMGGASFDMPTSDVVSATFVVLASHAGAQGVRNTAVAEVEFRGRG